MRVLHIGKYFPPVPGGIETFCGDLLGGFVDSEVTCRMLVHRQHHHQLPDHPQLATVRAYGEAFFTPVAPRFGAAVAQQLAQFQPDILHLHLPNPNLFRLLAMGPARRLPWVLNWHSDVVPSPHQWRLRLAYPFYRRFESAMLKRARIVLTASQLYADHSRPLKQMAPDRHRVVPFGIDPQRLTERVPVRWPDLPFRIAVVGRLTYYKGFDRLLKAVAQLPDAGVIMLGDGQERSSLQALIADLNLKQRVTLVTDASDALRNSVIASANCLCLPSIERTEAFGLVLVEAMALGTPVVATRIPGSGVSWVVENGGHGLLAEPDNVDSLTAALRQLQSEPGLARELTQQAAQNFPGFHIQQTVSALTRIYRELL